MNKLLQEQLRLAGVASRYSDYVVEGEEGAQALDAARDKAAEALAAAFNRLGRKAAVFGGGWNKGVEIALPELNPPSRLTFEIGSQQNRDDYVFYIELWTPTFNQRGDVAELHWQASQVLKGALSSFGRMGKAQFPSVGRDDVVKIWVDIPASKVGAAINDLPKTVAALAKPIDQALKE